ncbi:hypothetical protein [Nocardia vulneris]|nr:hypothetical protein [Nocardia vulneris]
MADPVCSDCWRRANLSFHELMDPAMNPKRRGWLCPEHWADRYLTEES